MRPGTHGITAARVTIFQDGPAGWSRKFRRVLSWETEMTSATMRQARDASHGEGYWMIVFAAMLLGLVGIFNLIDGIAAIAARTYSSPTRTT